MSGGAMSIGRYFTEMLDPSMTWDDVAEMVRALGRASSASRASCRWRMPSARPRSAARGIVLSNHGGRQLDGSRAAFDQLAEIVDAVGDRIDVMMDGGVQRGNARAEGAVARGQGGGLGRYYLFPLAAAGQAGVERALARCGPRSSAA